MIACALVAGVLLQGVGNKVTEVADASLEAEPHATPSAAEPDQGAVPAPALLYPLAAGK
jgi:hypothetical protein